MSCSSSVFHSKGIRDYYSGLGTRVKIQLADKAFAKHMTDTGSIPSTSVWPPNISRSDF